VAISSVISNDLLANTSTLTLSGDASESIIYSKSTNSFFFAAQPTFSITPSQYLQFSSMLLAFNVNVNNIFNPNSNVSSTFNISNVSDTNDGINSLNYLCSWGSNRLYAITSTYPLGNCVFGARNNKINLTFDEFQFYLLCSVHYKNEIIKSFHL